ncbi:MFS-type transporter SLC18B1 [Amphibalanus amphitrite]|uniref:MFS-type transporter SLC18B1 n=1 Tax=Amphibalanus amphitrite TaxID=1232801 RepID=A0A6A4VET5_AMPAM|nr:MFS-type transporter SLC18B1 [Amphibalanus amphitrite]
MTAEEGDHSEQSRLLSSAADGQDSSYSACSEPGDRAAQPGEGGPPAPLSREQRLLLACLCAGSLLGGCLVALMIPFFPVEAARRGVSETVTGAVFSCFAATQLLTYPAVGRAVPLLGVTRSYSAGLLLAALSTAAFGLLPLIADTTAFIAACFVTRAVEAVATCFINTASLTVVAHRFPGRTNTAIGTIETMTGVGVSLGPAVGGGLYRLAGYGLPFYALGGLLAAAAAVTGALMPSVAPPERRAGPLWPLVRALITTGEAWLCCLVLLAVSMNWTAIDPGIGPYVLSAVGVSPSELGLFFLGATGTFCVFSLAWGRLHDRVRNTYLLVTPCLLGAAGGLLLMAPSPLLPLPPSRWLLGVGMTLKELCQGGAYIPIFSRLLMACTRGGLDSSVHTQAFVSSAFWTVFSVGNVVGPTVGGALIDRWSFPVLTTALAGFSVLAAAASGAQALRIQLALSREPVVVRETEAPP